MEKKTSTSLRAEILLLLITAIWSATFLLLKYALVEVPPFLLTAFRFVLAAAIGGVVWGKYLRQIAKRDWIEGGTLGLVFGIGFILQTWGLQFTTVAKSSFITGSMVVFTPFVYFALERRNITYWQALGVVVVSVGLWIFTSPDFANINLGDVATLLCAVFWAVYIVLTDMFTRGVENIVEKSAILAFLQFLITAITAIAGFLVFELNQFGGLSVLLQKTFNSNVALFAILYTGILGSVFATYIQTRYQRDSSPVKAAIIFSLEPIVATVLAVAIAGESMHTVEIIGGILVVFGVLGSELGDMAFSKKTV